MQSGKWLSVSEEYTASIFSVEDGGSMFFQNVGTYIPDYRLHRIIIQKTQFQKLFSRFADIRFSMGCCWI
jgi:hypothetical protein